jgi:hypothetical protein
VRGKGFSGQNISSSKDLFHQVMLIGVPSVAAVCPPYELWHRGDVTLRLDEGSTSASCRRTARLHDARCLRSPIVRRHRVENEPVHVPKRGELRRMQDADAPHKWLYEPDEDHKRKHHWNQNEAGFVTVGATFVGKCPNNMSMRLAQTLVDGALNGRRRRGSSLTRSAYIASGKECSIELRPQFQVAHTTGFRNIRRDSLPEIGRYAIRS